MTGTGPVSSSGAGGPRPDAPAGARPVAVDAGRAGAVRACGALGRAVFALSAAVWLTACAAQAKGPPTPPHAATRPAAAGWKVVLVAGDGSLPVFDNAVRRMGAHLRDGAGVPASGIQRFSSDPAALARDGVQPASLDRVLGAVAGINPAAGQGCLVYATSHGVPSHGLALSLTGEVLTPDALDRALTAGCGDAPTVAILSGCYTGVFVRPPLARPNRVVLSAARADRPSFGCGAGYEYAVFDRCLLDAVERGGDWRRVYGAVRGCVTEAERRGGFPPSEPRAHFGPDVDGLPVPAGVARPGAPPRA